jgi:mycothiol synthase
MKLLQLSLNMPSTDITPYTIRNYQPADFDSYVRLRLEEGRPEPGGRPITPQTVAGSLSRPNHSPEQDIFVCEMSGSLIGYIAVMPETGIGRVILNCWLRPEHRQRGLATRLLVYALRRARETGARVAHINIMEDNNIARMVLTRLGFKCVRRFLELELDMARFRGPEASEAQECRHLRRGEENKLTRIQNLSFAEHWGYNPNTVATTTHRINLTQCSPEDIFLAHEGNKVLGFCWTETISQREGSIFMLGVAPDCQGKGTGRRLLLAGLSHLKSKGLRVAVLTVDSQNRTACALYQSVGFKLRASSLWYEKAVAQDTGAG